MVTPTTLEIQADSPVLTQQDYQWFENNNSKNPAVSLAGENTSIQATGPKVVYRIRMNLEATGTTLPIGAQAFKLQFATSTGGAFTDVGPIGSTGDLWVGFDNPAGSTVDGSTVPNIELSTTTVRETYEEENPSAVNLRALTSGDRGEWDWVVKDENAATSETCFFRMVRADGTPIDGYTNFPEISTTSPSTLTQQDYRWFQNTAGTDPTTPLAAENSPTTGATPLTVFRLRMNVDVATADVPADTQAFKLQCAVSTGGAWTDVGAIGSAETWRGFNNGGATDGATISTLLLTASDVLESYEESNPSVTNPNVISTGEQGEWDWVVENNNLASADTFFFRMVEDDGTPLDSYVNYPEIETVTPILVQEDYRLYENRDRKQPNVPLAAENTPFTASVTGVVHRIRMNVGDTDVDLPDDGLQFKLQFSTSTGGAWTDVGQITSGDIWRGFDNPGVADEANITTTLLSTSTVGESYEEESPSELNRNAINSGDRGEWDWVIENNGAASDTTYFFRMVRNDGTPLDGYTNYPTITTIPPTIAFDDFESGGSSGGTGWIASWVFSGDAGVTTLNGPHQGSFHLRLRRGTGHADRNVNLSGKTSARVQFWAKVRSFEGSENATFAVSSDGVSFTTIKTWVNGEDDNIYKFYDFDVVSFIGSNFTIAFDANMNQANDRIMFDEVRVVGE